VRAQAPEVFAAIKAEKALSDATQAKLRSILDNLQKTFA
jgi:hypothetical protein